MISTCICAADTINPIGTHERQQLAVICFKSQVIFTKHQQIHRKMTLLKDLAGCYFMPSTQRTRVLNRQVSEP